MQSRSYLFVPGDRPERFDKACATASDAVIVDLEDAVSPDHKSLARDAVAAWVSPSRPVLVRINGPSTEWFSKDLEVCRRPGISGIVLPKAEREGDIQLVAGVLGAETQILPIIESARGFWNVLEIALARPVRRLFFGSIDFQLDLGIDGEGEELLYFRSHLVLVSRIANLQPPVNGVSVAIDNPDQLRADTLRAWRMGFGGKLCIHPKQIDIVNECFLPSAEELVWARRVLEVASVAGAGAVTVDGKMVDRPIIIRAQQLVSMAIRKSS